MAEESTTGKEQELKCAVCGVTSTHCLIEDMPRVGTPDLDTRPPSPERFTIDLWVQRCPACGYCARDIATALPGASEMVKNEEYCRQLQSPEYPKLADSFLCLSFIYEAGGNFSEAGWSCIHAGWVCDDAADVVGVSQGLSGVSGSRGAQMEQGARRCRTRAIGLLKKARDSGQRFGAQVGAEEALMCDLLRRIGKFDSVIRMADLGLAQDPKEGLVEVLKFEKDLAGKSDSKVHTLAEALKDAWTRRQQQKREPGH